MIRIHLAVRAQGANQPLDVGPVDLVQLVLSPLVEDLREAVEEVEGDLSHLILTVAHAGQHCIQDVKIAKTLARDKEVICEKYFRQAPLNLRKGTEEHRTP